MEMNIRFDPILRPEKERKKERKEEKEPKLSKENRVILPMIE